MIQQLRVREEAIKQKDGTFNMPEDRISATLNKGKCLATFALCKGPKIKFVAVSEGPESDEIIQRLKDEVKTMKCTKPFFVKSHLKRKIKEISDDLHFSTNSLVIASVLDDKTVIEHAGNARCTLIKGCQTVFETEDETVLGEMIENPNRIIGDQRFSYDNYSLTNALGYRRIRVNTKVVENNAYETLLLTNRGYSILIPEEETLKILHDNKAFIDSENDSIINVCYIGDNEEVGSMTRQGADSTFLYDLLNIQLQNIYDIRVLAKAVGFMGNLTSLIERNLSIQTEAKVK